MKKTLVIITRNYPYGTEEISFLPQELEILEKYFDIILVPKFYSKELDISKCKYKVAECDCNIGILKKIGYIFLSVADIRFYKEVFLFYKKHVLSFCIIRQILADMVMSKNLDREIRKIIRNMDLNKDIIFYSYWYDYTLLSTTRYYRKYKTVTRAHGFDLYNERCASGYQCFKEQMDEKIANVIFISNYGKDYYCKNFIGKSYNPFKYLINHLGVRQQQFIPYQDSNVFRLISCSSVIPLKRIDKIIESLALIDEFPIEWTHVGSGANIQSIKKLAEDVLGVKQNITYTFTGKILNDKVLDLYRSNYYNCFILLSETEGLPVCIMEAMSFGIPVIANKVGGVSEIVSAQNGFLLDSYQDVNKIAKTIRVMHSLNQEENKQLKKSAYQTWSNSFNSVKNAEQLVEILEQD